MNGAWIRRLAAALCLCLLAALPAAARTAFAEQAAQARDVTRQCAFKVSEGSRDKLRDGNVRTQWSYSGDSAYVGVKLPEGVRAGWLRVEWMFDPTGYELIEYDAGQNELRRRNQTASFPNIYTVLPLLPETAYLQLKMTAKDQKICSVRVYSEGELPRDVQVWNPPVAKADLMVVSTHQDDELVFLGGTIPYYATALKKPTVVVYMTNCTRYRRNEALNALWKMGVRDYPEFINLKDEKSDSVEQAIELWGGKEQVLSLLVERIRRFKPEVIVTQDLNGEYGHNQHKATARAMKYAIEAAADPERFPDSLEKYGAWQVKKLYHHLYAENQITMDWETKLDSLNGYSPLKVAQIGMKEHASQLKYYAVKSHGTYDNSKFGLYYTTVGADAVGNDFLENIDPNASADYLAAHPEALELAAAWPQAAVTPAEEAPAEEAAPEAEPAEETLLPDEGIAPEEDAEIAAPEAEPEAVEAAQTPEIEPEGDAEEDGLVAAFEDSDAGTETEAVAEAVDAPVSEVGEISLEAAVDGLDAELALEPEASGAQGEAPEAQPAAGQDRGGSARGIALAAAAVAAAGAGGWAAYRAQARRRRRRRRRR